MPGATFATEGIVRVVDRSAGRACTDELGTAGCRKFAAGTVLGTAARADHPRSSVGTNGRSRGYQPGKLAAAAELKRMYVREVARGHGAGFALGIAALDQDGRLGYEVVRLDTTAGMVGAMRIYERLGFVPIAAYRHSPLEGARFYEVRLSDVTLDRTQPDTPNSRRRPPTDERLF